MHLAVALLRMAPNRFEMPFKKIYHNIESPSSSKESAEKGLRALYYLLIRKAKIENLSVFLKDGDDSQIILPVNKSPAKNKAFSTGR